MTTILVVGGTGFVGREITRSLVHLGHHVFVASRSGAAPAGAVGIELDATANLSQFNRIVRNVDPELLIQAAWMTDHGDLWASARNLDWVGATLNMARVFFEGGGRRFVGIGSGAEYSWPDYETSRNKPPDSLYGAAKLAAGDLLWRFCAGESLSFAWTRVFFTFGEGEAPQRFVPHLIGRLSAGLETWIDEPTLVRDYLPVHEVGRAITTVALGKYNGVLDIGSGSGITLSKLGAIIAGHLDAKDLLFRRAHGQSSSAPIVADTAALEQAGYRWEGDLHSAMREHLEAMDLL